MIDIRIDGNFDALDRSLVQLNERLFSLNILLEEMIPVLREIHAMRFEGFRKHLGSYKTRWYEKQKIERGLPVGVKSGKLRDALTRGGDGEFIDIRSIAGIGWLLEFGIDESSFERGYPKYFVKWLEERGDDLVGLSDADVTEFESNFFRVLDQYLTGV